ncbi:hypothetical protein [Weizmannia acidilactici]|uniref:hypothetical protein n=1 Tax=Weizmannia acidilactici TaxID=2607726 RepID=UPI001561EA89|nr:hypothetical protein [Weizmannia acidilactici]
MSNYSATFIDCNMGQLILPMDFSDMIPKGHVARVVNDMVNQISDDILTIRRGFLYENVLVWLKSKKGRGILKGTPFLFLELRCFWF